MTITFEKTRLKKAKNLKNKGAWTVGELIKLLENTDDPNPLVQIISRFEGDYRPIIKLHSMAKHWSIYSTDNLKEDDKYTKYYIPGF